MAAGSGGLLSLRAMHILLDLDGTLTDPRDGIVRSLEHAFQKLGHPLPPDVPLTSLIGPPLHEALANLLGTTERARIEEAVAAYRERYGEVGLFENHVYPGIPEALATLRDRGHELRVVTSKAVIYARRVLAHFDLDRFFEAVHGSEFDGRRANKGELIRYTLTVDGLAPDDVVMIGDRKHDLDGARSAGVRGIGVLWGFGDRAELAACAPVALVPTVAELPAAVAGLEW